MLIMLSTECLITKLNFDIWYTTKFLPVTATFFTIMVFYGVADNPARQF